MGRMESTHLNLLTRDGSLSITFRPPLEEVQYTELDGLVRQCDDPHELRTAILQAANVWERSVEID
jgi:hypothetical protein